MDFDRAMKLADEIEDLEKEETVTENICLSTNSSIGMAHYNRQLVKIRERISKLRRRLNAELDG